MPGRTDAASFRAPSGFVCRADGVTDRFERAFAAVFGIDRREPVAGTSRVLYPMRRLAAGRRR